MNAVLRSLSLLVLSVVLAASAYAEWSSDPAENLAIADRAGEQVIPKVAARADGGCYVAWFDLASGNYDVYIQRLDAAGGEEWPHNGILVSDHPQNTWLTDWDLIADSAGDAVLTFGDARGGEDFDIQAYKIGADGSLSWGPDGVSLSSNADFEAAPRVAEASNGDLVFVWSRQPDVVDGSLMMQRLTPEGVPLLAPGGLAFVSFPGESPGFCDVVAAENGNVIVSWVRDIATYLSNRHLRAGKFSPAGALVWPAWVNVFDATVLPIAYDPVLQSDGAGGALLGWHRSQSNYYNAFVQHLDAAGTELFGHNGVAVSTVSTRHHIDPSLAYAVQSGELFVFWNERNSNQSQWGIFAQKFSPAGARQWGTGGLQLLAVDTVFKYGPRSLPWADGAMVFLIDEPGGWGHNRVIGMRLDAAGDQLWGDSPLIFSSLQSGKARLPVDMDPSGVVKLIWEDDRSGSVDVYGQNVRPDGSLGVPTGVGETPSAQAAGLLQGNYPNPFNPKTTIRFELPEPAQASLAIYALSGRLVRVLMPAETRAAGSHEVTWDGRDEDGMAASSGVYLCRLVAGSHSEARRLVLLK